jgi:hypothetical protein
VQKQLGEQMQFFAGLEADCLAGRNGDLCSGSGIAADACLPWLDGKDAKATEFNAIACNQCLFHALEDSVYRSFCFSSWQAGAFNNPLYKILLDHFWAAVLGLLI